MNPLLNLLLDEQSLKEKLISGQIIFRESSPTTKDLDGSDRKLMMFFGIVAVPKDFEYLGEHQYTVNGYGSDRHIFKKSEINQAENTLGDSPTGILRKAIWRI